MFEVELETKTGKSFKREKVEVETILMAIGRDPNPKAFGAQLAGINIDEST